MRHLKRSRRRRCRAESINLGTRYALFQRLAGKLFGATHAVVAAQCGSSKQSLHETQMATGLSRNTVAICLNDFSRAGLGLYSRRLFCPSEDRLLQRVVNRLTTADLVGAVEA